MTADNENAAADAEAKKRGRPPQPRQPKELVQSETGTEEIPDSMVKAVCLRPCVCMGAYRRIGETIVFYKDKVSPHFKIID